MLRKLVWLILVISVLLLLIPPWRQAYSAPEPVEAPLEAPQASISDLITLYAKKYQVSEEMMYKVMECENRELDPKLQSRIINKKGEREKSYGLVQIHLPSHPNVSYTQATDPEFSVKFLAKNLSEGKGGMWTCYRKYY